MHIFNMPVTYVWSFILIAWKPMGEVYYTNLLPYIKFEQMDRQTDRGKT